MVFMASKHTLGESKPSQCDVAMVGCFEVIFEVDLEVISGTLR